MLKFVLLLSKAILRDQHARRQLMFYVVLAAMLMAFAGATFLQGWLREHVLLLLGYWALCAGLTIFAALLAIFDILLLRLAARAARRQLEAEYMPEEKPPQRDQP